MKSAVFMPLLVAGVAFAPDGLGRQGEVQDGFATVEVLKLCVGSEVALQFNFVRVRHVT